MCTYNSPCIIYMQLYISHVANLITLGQGAPDSSLQSDLMAKGPILQLSNTDAIAVKLRGKGTSLLNFPLTEGCSACCIVVSISALESLKRLGPKPGHGQMRWRLSHIIMVPSSQAIWPRRFHPTHTWKRFAAVSPIARSSVKTMYAPNLIQEEIKSIQLFLLQSNPGKMWLPIAVGGSSKIHYLNFAILHSWQSTLA